MEQKNDGTKTRWNKKKKKKMMEQKQNGTKKMME